jgi:hypothetical protein
MKSIAWFISTGLILVLILFGVYSLVGVPVGTFMDWLISILGLMWLFLIVTVPWNAHFNAREILDEAEISKRKDILVIESSLSFARRVAKRSLWMAIGLHMVSAVGLYILAISNVSPVGYVGAVLAVLLALLRPSVRMYEYLQKRLASIREEFRYPRQDINELLSDVQYIKSTLNSLETLLSTDTEQPSWRKEIDSFVAETKENLVEFQSVIDADRVKSAESLKDSVQQLKTDIAAVRTEHSADMQRIAVDSQILDSVRILANFVKQFKN